MPDAPKNCSDWAGDWWSLSAIWGLPCAAMLAAAFLDPLSRTVIWTLALVWMGTACLANARRCSRTHCRFTGPFLLVMAALVVAYSAGALPLGAYGWAILGVVAAIGNAILWWASERVFGRFLQSTPKSIQPVRASPSAHE